MMYAIATVFGVILTVISLALLAFGVIGVIAAILLENPKPENRGNKWS